MIFRSKERLLSSLLSQCSLFFLGIEYVFNSEMEMGVSWSRFLILFFLSCLCLVSQGRTWTDASGRQFEATLIRQEGDKVLLNISGRQRTFQLSQLSAIDQSFVRRGIERTPTKTPSRKPQQRRQIQADVGIKVERLRAEPRNNRWVYGSPNFEFVCTEDLGFAAVRKFAWMFESVWQFCETLPFDVPRLRAQEKVRMKTYLIKDYANYIKMGGRPKTLGVYIPSQDVVLVPFLSLDLKKAPGWKDGNNTLRHEVTHQLMRGQSQQAGWFIEGVAEYVATVPYAQNRLLTDRHLKSIVAMVSADGWNQREGYNLGQRVNLIRLQDFLVPDYATFQTREHAYPYALILFTYFARLDGQRDGAGLAKYVSALQDGVLESDARKHLLNGRSYEELEKDIAKAWNLHGLRLSFR